MNRSMLSAETSLPECPGKCENLRRLLPSGLPPLVYFTEKERDLREKGRALTFSLCHTSRELRDFTIATPWARSGWVALLFFCDRLARAGQHLRELGRWTFPSWGRVEVRANTVGTPLFTSSPTTDY
jgi:hypothetical protein